MPADYFSRAIAALDEPQVLWRVAFESHLDEPAQAILLTLSSLPDRVDYDQLRTIWTAYCDHCSIHRKPGAYDRALRTLEGSFISISAEKKWRLVSFSNPSVSDFIISFLNRNSQELTALLASARYFAQVQRLWGFGTSGTWNYRLRTHEPKDGIRKTLSSQDNGMAAAIERVFQSENVQLKRQWPGRTLYRVEPSMEDRLLFVLSLPEQCRPTDSWIQAQLNTILARWREHVGVKPSAIRLIAAVTAQTPPTLILDLRTALLEWLRHEPEDMDDWAPLLDFSLTTDPETRIDIEADFREFASVELDRWSPVPPDFDTLVDYLERSGLTEDLDEAVEAAKEREREADRDAARQEPDETAEDDTDDGPGEASDAEIALLFATLSPRADGDRRELRS